jgi:hypothetical protein
MKFVATRFVLICLTSVAACTSMPAPPPVVAADGVAHYKTDGARQTIHCDERPIELDGYHTTLVLTGPCRMVRLVGWHNDIDISLVPGGTIEITGSHNDVSWHPTEPGPKPTLLDHGDSNTFHNPHAAS